LRIIAYKNELNQQAETDSSHSHYRLNIRNT